MTPLPLCCQDIILTVKEKLSIRSIEYFALALEEQYSISRLHLLHEEELVQQVGRPGFSATAGLDRVHSLGQGKKGKTLAWFASVPMRHAGHSPRCPSSRCGGLAG